MLLSWQEYWVTHEDYNKGCFRCGFGAILDGVTIAPISLPEAYWACGSHTIIVQSTLPEHITKEVIIEHIRSLIHINAFEAFKELIYNIKEI